MAVVVDFLLVCTPAVELPSLLASTFDSALQAAGVESSGEEALLDNIEIRYQRTRDDGMEMAGVTLMVDADGPEARSVIENLTTYLVNAADDGVVHAVKTLDQSLLETHQPYFEEIFELEMKLREALSYVFIESDTDRYYDLLADVEPTAIRKEGEPTPDQMRKVGENEFFHLLFSDYIGLDTRKRPTNAGALVQIIASSADLDDLKARLSLVPNLREDYLELLARLKTSMEPVEQLRNCVAHNRAIPARVSENYQQALPELMQTLDDFFRTLADTPDEETEAD